MIAWRGRGVWWLAWVGLTGCGPSFEATRSDVALPRSTSEWAEYGGGGGRRFADAALIDPGNVAGLEVAWVYRTGDQSDGSSAAVPTTSAFEATPILAGGRLVFCTPFNRVIALDPLTGGELWRHDPGIDLSGHYANQLICRGVAQWHDDGAADGACAARIFSATNDGYLLALDLQTGMPCQDFGNGGRVDLNRGVGDQAWLGEYQVTSAPTVIGELVVVGSAVSDNVRIDAPSGVVRAFDARSGAQAWAWDLAPPDFDYAAADALVSDEGFALGTPNVWGTMTADEARGLLFVPTGNPAPDYYRSGEPDMDFYGSAVVALEAATGRVVWHFNTVRNDFWDYDVGAQPALADLVIDGRPVPAVVQGTKMGFVFVLHRETGEPLVDTSLLPVPRHGPLAAQLSPEQPFPPPAFRVAREVTRDDAWGLTFWDRGRCRALLDEMVVGPIYTPVTEQWTVVAPSNTGGINWGGVAVDAGRGIIVARSTNLPFQVKLIARENFSGARDRYPDDVELGPQRGMAYAMARKALLSPIGLPCTAPPWGTVTAIDVAGERQLWQRPHGTVADLSPVPIAREYGVPGMGQGVITGSGLIFIGGAFEHALRAFALDTGEELWRGRLPAPPVATPMTYVVTDAGRDRQFVVIAAGGHGRAGVSVVSDHLVAFALPDR
jgi:quinoprotein glucose dehydrogenase